MCGGGGGERGEEGGAGGLRTEVGRGWGGGGFSVKIGLRFFPTTVLYSKANLAGCFNHRNFSLPSKYRDHFQGEM